MKKMLFVISLVCLLSLVAATYAVDSYFEDFNTAALWGGGTMTSYNEKFYTNDVALPLSDYFTTTSAVRETAYIMGASGYSWRLGSTTPSNVYFRYVCQTNVTDFSVYLARWDNSPTPLFEVRYSTNSGATYTTLLATNGDWFTADATFKQYMSPTLNIVPEAGQLIYIEVLRTTGERIVVDDFYLNPPATLPSLAITNPADAILIVVNGAATANIQGDANANVIGEIAWTNSLTGGAGTIAAATSWTIAGLPLGVGLNSILIVGTNGTGDAALDSVQIMRQVPESTEGSPIALINEVEFNGAGTDTNDFIEIVAPAGSNLVGCFIVHYNGADAGDGSEWRFDIPDFVVPDDGITDTLSVPLGFCVIAQTGGVANADFEIPSAGLQGGPDGIVLYDANSNILDAVAWGGAGDLNIDDPGTVITIGDPRANNYLHVTGGDSAGTDTAQQAPNNVRGDTGAGWSLEVQTPGGINVGQTSGFVIVTAGIPPNNPEVTITNPAAASLVVPNATTTYDVQGTCNTSVVGQLSWTNSLTGSAGTIAAAATWTISGIALDVGDNFIAVAGTNSTGDTANDSVTITREALPPPAHTVAFINEVEFNGAGTDTNDFVEIIAPAGTNLHGCFLIHYNGSDTSDGGIWRFDFPVFTVPDDGITDTNGVALGFCIISVAGGGVPNSDFVLPGDMQAGPDGLVLYDASSNILDAVAWGGPGDMAVDDPGTVTTSGDPAAPNYLRVTVGDTQNTNTTVQAPNMVLADNGSGWTLIFETPGAINGGQTNGMIDITGGGNPNIAELAITNPAAASVIVGNATLTADVQGTANTNVVGQILWTNDLTGGAGSIAASTEWSINNIPLAVGLNVITVTGTNAFDESVSDVVSIHREVAATYNGSPIAFFNEIEANSTGTDTGDYIEVIAPAGSNLVGCFIVHYDGADGGDGGIWRFDFPSFVVPDDGVMDTNGVHLGFCLIGQTAGVVNTDFELPGGLQGGPDGVILYDADSNILDAVAWSGPGDMSIDDPGTVITIGDSTANNFVKITTGDSDNDTLTLQAPNDVRNVDAGLSLWLLFEQTPGAINLCQTSGYLIVTSDGGPGPIGDQDGDGISDDYENTYFGGPTNADASADSDGDGDPNLWEYLADTIPVNPLGSNSYFELQAIDSGNSKSITFVSSTGRVYTFQYNDDLRDGNSWSNLQVDVPGTNIITTLTDPAEMDDRAYRVRVRVP